jgi:CheY-like chemotaxis protein
MPGIDGVSLIKVAHRDHPKLPAILLTGYVQDTAALAVGGATSGTFSLLRKPVLINNLTDRIASLIAVVPSGG